MSADMSAIGRGCACVTPGVPYLRCLARTRENHVPARRPDEMSLVGKGTRPPMRSNALGWW